MLALAGLVMIRTLGPNVPEARAAAEESLAIWERMGAQPLIEQLRQELAGAGRAPAPEAKAVPVRG